MIAQNGAQRMEIIEKGRAYFNNDASLRDHNTV